MFSVRGRSGDWLMLATHLLTEIRAKKTIHRRIPSLERHSGQISGCSDFGPAMGHPRGLHPTEPRESFPGTPNRRTPEGDTPSLGCTRGANLLGDIGEVDEAVAPKSPARASACPWGPIPKKRLPELLLAMPQSRRCPDKYWKMEGSEKHPKLRTRGWAAKKPPPQADLRRNLPNSKNWCHA